MEVDVSLIVCGHDATPQNLAVTDMTHTYRWAVSPEQIIATIKHDQRLGTAHLILSSSTSCANLSKTPWRPQTAALAARAWRWDNWREV